ncbi:S-locus glycoprotein domain-containing protein [Artemisia annua]|uniref:S-locus glycoprotein domain-containing protein n=1 Tax=Artemisia annua TaxID=35608 RepID=A0A2U1NYQ5_ARTAN|nr:S-locus glycoprotein domain-containing protein [Artemisia annua]
MILMEEATILVLLVFSINMQKICTAEIDIISYSSFLTENDTLVSPGRTFELGFFKPGSSDNTYVGIWYKQISVKTVVWVANRDYPLTTNNVSSSMLRIDSVGNLVLKNYTDHVVWSSNSTSSGNATAQLYDSGNLVITDGNSMKILWESFDYPTDTRLPGMKLGKNYLTGAEWHLTSWKSIDDPTIGEFTWSMDTRGYPHFVLRDGLEVKFRHGPWNGERFSGSSWHSTNMYFSINHAHTPSVFKKNGGTNIKKIILIVVFLVVFVISLSTWWLYAWKKRHLSPQIEEGGSLNVGESGREAMELPLFSFSRVAEATANFSLGNKLGEGGFGPVYKSNILIHYR